MAICVILRDTREMIGVCDKRRQQTKKANNSNQLSDKMNGNFCLFKLKS